MKKCPKCQKSLDHSLFNKDSSNADGLSCWCKYCCSEKNKQWRDRNREKSRNDSKRWRDSNPEKRKHSARSRLWNISHPQRVQASATAWLKNNAERVKEKRRAWYAKNPEKGKIYFENRRALKIANGGNITKKEWSELVEKYNHCCLCCRRSDVKLTMDHVVPLKLGGQHRIDNIQPLCLSCNSRKSTNITDYRRNYDLEFQKP